jgi:hypothetical protein
VEYILMTLMESYKIHYTVLAGATVKKVAKLGYF